MGSEDHYPDEGPVALEGFDIDRHEVANAQFQRFVEATAYVTDAERAAELGFEADGSTVFTKSG